MVIDIKCLKPVYAFCICYPLFALAHSTISEKSCENKNSDKEIDHGSICQIYRFWDRT
jgi:hypothetical protein